MNVKDIRYYEAQLLFQRLRFRAAVESLLNILRGKRALLCSFEGISRDFHLRSHVYRGVQEVPLDQIVGSTGRDQDFTRRFLPRRRHLRNRWVGIYTLVTGSAGPPPVKLYQVCDAYFVLDGNHRVSVAKYLKTPTIQAEVITFATDMCIPAACL